MDPQAITELMHELGKSDPSLAKRLELMQTLFERYSGARSQPSEVEQRQLSHARVRALHKRGRALHALCARLADALGACACFGENPKCRNCSGNGRPGVRDPDPRAFEVFVMPALERLNQTKSTE